VNPLAASPHSAYLVACAAVTVLLLLLLIAKVRLHPALALAVGGMGLGLISGMPLEQVPLSFSAGVGNLLGHVAVVLALGAVLGRMLASSGGAAALGKALIEGCGERGAPWALLAMGLLVGMPVFFEVGLVLLLPIVAEAARRSGKPPILVGLPVLAGLSIVHAVFPPHPAAMLAAAQFHADLGRTMLWGLMAGLPAAALAGPGLSWFLLRRWSLKTTDAAYAGPELDLFTPAKEAEAEPAPLEPRASVAPEKAASLPINRLDNAAFHRAPTGREIDFGHFPRAALRLPWAIFAASLREALRWITSEGKAPRRGELLHRKQDAIAPTDGLENFTGQHEALFNTGAQDAKAPTALPAMLRTAPVGPIRAAAAILLPVALIFLGSWADALAEKGSFANRILHFTGSPDVALLIAVLVALLTLGPHIGREHGAERLRKLTGEAFAPIAGVLVILAAAGGLSGVLRDSGAAQATVSLALGAHMPPLVLAWLLAAVVRVSMGSATVAMAVASGVLAPMAAHMGVRPELLVLATGTGSIILSHVNDPGFWMIQSFFKTELKETLSTWTVLETILSVAGLGMTLLLSAVLG
jgi:GntP family gluconate:H+ symporter